MVRLTSYLLGGGTLACALGIGYVMQYGVGAPGQDGSAQTVAVTDIQLASSAIAAPRLPRDLELGAVLPEAPVELAAVQEPAERAEPANLPRDVAAGFDCEITMDGAPAAGAMVEIRLSAPCHASERVTIHHHGLMFTEVLQPDGTLSVTVPAMASMASFMAAFANGDGAMTTADVSSLEFYDRVAVQWKGNGGLQLHAREFDAPYFAEGHVWAASAGDLAVAARGEGGFLTRLGRSDAPDALLAEIYSFPTGTASRAGDVLLSVEAEITAANCDTTVEAQTLELRGSEAVRVRDLSLEMPDCDSIGDFLVLKNLVEDLKIASR